MNRVIQPLSEEFIYASPEYPNSDFYRLLSRDKERFSHHSLKNRKGGRHHAKKQR